MTRLLLLAALAFGASASAQTVFVNEIHYDNSGPNDLAEGVEIAGPAGTDLSGYTISLYNGTNSQRSVYDTINLSGTIPNQENGYGTLNFLRADIQNGAPDGLSLNDAGGTPLQFLCYEGTFVAASGPAVGQTCTDIGVEESSGTSAGQSLQLQGTGTTYTDFTWAGPITATAGSVNTGQAFTAASGITVQFALAGAAVGEGDGTYDLDVTISAQPASNTPVDVVLNGGASTGNAADLGGYTTQTVTFTPTGATTQSVSLTITDDGDTEAQEGVQFDLGNLTGDPAATLGTPASFDLTINDNDVAANVLINEFDADTAVDDDREFVELYDGGAGNTPLDGLVIVFYNGSDDLSYDAIGLDGHTTNADGFFVLGDAGVPGVDLVFSSTATNGQIQNGPDAIALFEGDAADFPNDTPITTSGLRMLSSTGRGMLATPGCSTALESPRSLMTSQTRASRSSG